MAELGKLKFWVHGCRKDDGRKVDSTAELTLYESGAFKYGNQTGMSLVWDGDESSATHFDTRYEKFSPKTWPEWAGKWLQGYVAEGLIVEMLEES